ncbi:MAG: metallophosphoesterase [Cytophagales bacterium]|nr:metallophosphoesterase [Rhizobacter sp.]
MTLLLHISDPHFGTEQPQVLGALLRVATAQRPDLVVLSGDITQRARRDQFRSAREFIDRLGAPCTLAIPGNHDIPLFNLAARLFWPYANFQREFGALAPAFESPALFIVTVITTRRGRHKNGQVSARQIEHVAERLSRAHAGQLRVVVVHQPIAVQNESDEHDRLRGHAAATQRWAEAGADLVLGGHIHLPYVLPLHERVPGLTRRLWAVQAGTALSNRVRDGVPNSLNLIRWGGPLPPGRCVIERWDFRAEAGEFAHVSETVAETGSLQLGQVR